MEIIVDVHQALIVGITICVATKMPIQQNGHGMETCLAHLVTNIKIVAPNEMGLVYNFYIYLGAIL